MNVLKDMADTIRTMTATLTSTSASTSPKLRMNQESHSGPAEMLNPEIEGFLQILKGSLGRTPSISRLTCLIELLPILKKYEEV